MSEKKPVDWRYWLSLDLWKLDDACLLLSGANPESVPSRQRDDWWNKSKLWHIATASVKAHKLKCAEYKPNEKFSVVEPKVFLEWAQSKDVEIPPELQPLIADESTGANISADVIDGRERDILLKIIYGMAVKKYDYNPSAAKNSATGEKSGSIFDDLEKLGLRVSSDAIRRHLVAAVNKFGDVTKRAGK